MEGIECSGFTFFNEFDSANLARVDFVDVADETNSINEVAQVPDASFNIWTKPDCGGTEFQNGNRTWFYFGVRAPSANLLVQFNIVDINRQSKMYSQGMAPVYRVVPGKSQWQRIKDKPMHNIVDDIFTLSFKYRMPENEQSIAYFAFTYPYSYADLQKMLETIDERFANIRPTCKDDIYYVRETVCSSLEGRDVSLLTISSHHGMLADEEDRLRYLFPDKQKPRPYKFTGKKVVFISARVHPGETPSTYVFNGLLHLLLKREDPVALMLRRLYVFKMIPFLNPDGVARGHYRTDTRGVNLNRVYTSPSLVAHPPIYAARSLLRYYHCGRDIADEQLLSIASEENIVPKDAATDTDSIIHVGSHISSEATEDVDAHIKSDRKNIDNNESRNSMKISSSYGNRNHSAEESGLFLYIDLHGHASKKGIFMYGNHFSKQDEIIECMLLPKLMSINNHNFHFTSCNFTERNMYLRDRHDGMSREGSGRVAVLKLTGLIKSYTLECNYNTGRIVNVLPPTVREGSSRTHRTLSFPPKYTPAIFEEVGASLGASILDLTGHNPCTRLPNSEFHNLSGVRNWLRAHGANQANEFKAIAKSNMRRCVSIQVGNKSTEVMKKDASSCTTPPDVPKLSETHRIRTNFSKSSSVPNKCRLKRTNIRRILKYKVPVRIGEGNKKRKKLKSK